jgi:short-subunit dehydrogenase
MVLGNWKGDWALITGASSGIGREFANQLGAAGLNLVLVARRKPLLDNLAADLSERYGGRVITIPIDLSQLGAISAVGSRLFAEQVRVRLLCNNAAFGSWGPFEKTSAPTYQQMIELNIGAMVELCHHFLPDLASHSTSAIINVSSPAAFQPIPYMAVYAATKSFVHNFSQALYGEWKDRGIMVQSLVPGPTATEFDDVAGAYASAVKDRGTPHKVVKDALDNLGKDTPVVMSAKGTYQQRFFAALFPPKMVIRTVKRMFEPPGTSG